MTICSLRFRLPFACALFISAIIAASFAGTTLAQLVPTQYQNGGQNGIIVSVDREQRQLLVRAERAIENEQFADASLILGDILKNPDVADYFLNPLTENGPQPSLKAITERMIGDLPPAGREAYELQYGGQAKKLLETALTNRDEKQLADVTRMYFHTVAGYRATMLLGRIYLDRGEFLSAGMTFDRLTDVRKVADEFEPELSILAALSWRSTGDEKKAQAVLKNLKAKSRTKTFRVGGEELKLFASDADALAWLDGLGGKPGIEHSLKTQQWVMHRGDASRNAQAGGGMPVSSIRWRIPTADLPADEMNIVTTADGFDSQRIAAIPVMQPLAVGDVILARMPGNTDVLVAIDYHTGKRMWKYPYDVRNDTIMDETGDYTRLNKLQKPKLTQRIWEDAVFGQLASDGNYVFLISDFGLAGDVGGNKTIVGNQGRIQINQNRDRTNNNLMAFGLQKQGFAIWDTQTDPELQNAFFLGSPLPLMGRLYVLAEANQEIQLMVLDAHTGALQWKQQLGRIESREIKNDTVRRLAGSSPSFADGVLVCPTTAGTLIGVDLATRRLLWGYNYTEEPQQPTINRGIRRYAYPRPKAIGKKWIDATATIAGGKVIITPVETDQLHCIDLLTGAQAWKPVDREDGLYVACVHDNIIYIVGETSMRAIRLDKEGEDAWEKPLSLPGRPSGRGYQTGDFYTLPTSEKKVVRINLKTGQIEQTMSTETVLGNLVTHKETVISHSYDTLTAFRQDAPLRDEVRSRLKKNPNDTWALTRQGELLAQDGQTFAALDPLRKALKIDSDLPDTQNLLVKTLLTALREDYEKRSDLVEEARSLIRRPEDREELLRLIAVGLKASPNRVEAFEAFRNLANAQPDIDSDADLKMERVGDSVYLRRDRWVRNGLAEILNDAGDDRDGLTKIVLAESNKAIEAGTPRSLRRFLRYFGDHEIADKVKLALTTQLIRQKEFAEAQYILTQLVSRTDKATKFEATKQLAELALAAGNYGDVAELYNELAKVDPAQANVANELLEKATLEHPQIKTTAFKGWNAGAVSVETTTDGRQSIGYQRIFPIELRSISPDRAGYKLAYDQRQNVVIGYDPMGKILFRQAIFKNVSTRRYYVSSPYMLHARWHGTLAVVSTGAELVAIDTFQAAQDSSKDVLWRKDMVESVLSTNGTTRSISVRVTTQSLPWKTGFGMPTDMHGNLIGATGPITNNGVCLTYDTTVACVEPTSGKVIWERKDIAPGSNLSGDENHIVVHQPAGDWLVLSMYDGKKIAERKIPNSGKLWFARGGRGLVWWQNAGQLTMASFNGIDGETTWSHQVPVGSKATLVGQDEVAIAHTKGEFSIRSLTTTEPIVSAKLAAEKILMDVHVLRSSQDYLVAISGPNVVARDIQVMSAPMGSIAPLVVGKLYSFDRQTGKANWQTPAEIDRFGFPTEQMAESPVVVFMRHITPLTTGKARRRHSSVLMIDRRDGSVIYHRDDIPGDTQSWQFSANRLEQKVTVQVQATKLSVSLTDHDSPPQPPAQTGQYLKPTS